MTVTITWVIESMQTVPSVDGHTNVVVSANWRCIGVDGNYSASNYGSVTFASPGNPFTNYADLTQAQVLGWVWTSGVDQTAVEASVTSQVELLVNPPVIVLPNPW
jgi:hypothetical protein